MAKPKILIVDPDEKNLRILAISLKKSDFNVTVSTDGDDALSKVETLKPDLVISEIDLGSTDGFTLLKFIRETAGLKDTPFIFLTKNKNIDEKVKGLKLGANDYLTKPIYLKEIVTRVKILLERVERSKMEIGVDRGFSGDLSNMGVVELIQALELGSKTAIMRLKYKTHEGVVYFKKGRIVHAEVGKIKGEKAFYLMLNWNEGTFQIEFTDHNIVETITTSNQGLLMEGLRRIDEWKQLQEIIPPLDTVLVIDSQAILNEHPEQFPSKVENIMAEFDGKRSILDVIESLDMDEIEALKIISQLYFQGFLVESIRPPDDKRITYYYPARFAQNVESVQKEDDKKTWVSEAEDFLSRSSSVGEDTAFLQPPVEEIEKPQEVQSEPPAQPAAEAKPVEEEKELPKHSEKVIYLKTVQEQKLKQSPPLQLGDTLTLSEQPVKKIEKQIVAMSAKKEKTFASSRAIYIVAGIIVILAPVIFYGVPELRSKFFPAKSSVSVESTDHSTIIAKAESLIRSSNFEEAVKILSDALKTEQKDAQLYYLSAKAYLGIPEKQDLAVDALHNAIKLSPSEPKYRLELAELLKEKGKLSEAEVLLKEFPEIQNNKDALFMLANIQENEGKLSDAITTYRNLLKLEQGNVEVGFKIARLSLESGDYATIEDVLKPLDPNTISEPLSLERSYLLARSAEGQNRKTEAIEEYKKILAKSGDYKDVKERLSRIEKPPAPSVSSASRAVEKPSTEIQYEAAMKRGREFYKRGELEKAIEEFKTANKLKPKSDEPLVELGTALFDLGNDIDAILKLTQAITINPKNSRALLLLGNIYYARGDRDKAVNYYEKFLQIAPNSPYAAEVRTILGRLK